MNEEVYGKIAEFVRSAHSSGPLAGRVDRPEVPTVLLCTGMAGLEPLPMVDAYNSTAVDRYSYFFCLGKGELMLTARTLPLPLTDYRHQRPRPCHDL